MLQQANDKPEDADDIIEEMVQSVIDVETLDDLFRDLSACAQVIEVLVKRGQGHVRDEDTSPDLMVGRAMLEQEDVRGIQVRYLFEGFSWMDTLMKVEHGYQLVRVRHELNEK